ncbi:MAG: ribonuclease III [Hyphomicrobiaceae bacterium]|nr:ribonuclease III [Hyphomicrobiaceae bacterium]
MRRQRPFADLEKTIGYKFKDGGILERALTHASLRGGKGVRADNERLEFIGDRVLGLAIAELLGELYPDAREGELARRFNKLVCGDACAMVARDIGLGAHLILSAGEADSGGRDKDTILADAMEALLAAIFLDGGFAKSRTVIRAIWSRHVEGVPAAAGKDAKSALQEWAQGRGLSLPAYKEVGRSGPDHAPSFEAEVRIGKLDPARGAGPSKRIAEQSAAAALLIREGVWPGENRA